MKHRYPSGALAAGYSLPIIESLVNELEELNKRPEWCFYNVNGYAHLKHGSEIILERLEKFIETDSSVGLLFSFSSQWEKHTERKNQVSEFIKRVRAKLKRFELK